MRINKMNKILPKIGLIIIVLPLLLCCLKKKEIKEFPTAVEQFDYAAIFHQMRSGKVLQKENKKAVKEIIQHYQKVIDKFPDDDVYTPEAKLQVANGYYVIKEYKKAMKYYNSILNGKSKLDYHYARALKGIGDCYGIENKRDLAVKYWSECVNKYKDSDNQTVIKIVEDCKKSVSL